MTTFRMVFPGAPIAKGRPRFTRQGRAYTPLKTRNAEVMLIFEARRLWQRPPLEIPVCLDVSFYLKEPKKPKFPVPAVRGDIDNYLKTVLDALNGIVWLDDGLVTDVIMRKRYHREDTKGESLEPCTVLTVNTYV